MASFDVYSLYSKCEWMASHNKYPDIDASFPKENLGLPFPGFLSNFWSLQWCKKKNYNRREKIGICSSILGHQNTLKSWTKTLFFIKRLLLMITNIEEIRKQNTRKDQRELHDSDLQEKIPEDYRTSNQVQVLSWRRAINFGIPATSLSKRYPLKINPDYEGLWLRKILPGLNWDRCDVDLEKPWIRNPCSTHLVF